MVEQLRYLGETIKPDDFEGHDGENIGTVVEMSRHPDEEPTRGSVALWLFNEAEAPEGVFKVLFTLESDDASEDDRGEP